MVGKTLTNISKDSLAGIQYFGLAGMTGECLDGIKRLIHFGDKIHEAKLLTCKDKYSIAVHAFILTINNDEIIGIKSGFASGYLGEGSKGFAKALQLLIRQRVKIEEYEVEKEIINRLDQSCLLASDLEKLKNLNPVRPTRYTGYVIAFSPEFQHLYEYDYDNEKLWSEFPATIPFGLIDSRLVDLALDFFDDPDSRLLSAFRRLEDIVKKRTNIKGKNGSKLFSEAFQKKNSVLYWEDDDNNKHASKASMFIAVFGAYRNPRAHQETSSENMEYLREFLLINELYVLESTAVKRPLSGNE